MMMTIPGQAAPSAIEDEAFLLFLAETLEDDEGKLIDPLSMSAPQPITSSDEQTTEKTNNDVSKQPIQQAQHHKEEDHE